MITKSISFKIRAIQTSECCHIYTEALTAVCGKSDCLNTPFVTQSFHYILGIL